MPADKPVVHLNLDTLTREDAPEPFGFVLAGKRFVCADPNDLDFRELSAVPDADIDGQMRLLLADEYEKFRQLKLSLRQVRKLNAAMMEHYGLGEGLASTRS